MADPSIPRRPAARFLIPGSIAIVLMAIAIGCLGHRDGRVLTLDLGSGVKLQLIRIPAGEFMMGSPESEADRDPSEGPRHPVRIARPFYLGQFEITQAQWRAVMNNDQSQIHGPGDLPADSISYGDCLKFCTYASQRTGRTVRLPTEAEWEYACRAGTITPFSFTGSLGPAQANIKADVPPASSSAGPHLGKTRPVGQYPPNAFGLYDMHGNVAEWCQDIYRDSYDAPPGDAPDPARGDDQAAFIYRGGSWKNAAGECRSAIRFASQKDLRTESVGFRVVVEAR